MKNIITPSLVIAVLLGIAIGVFGMLSTKDLDVNPSFGAVSSPDIPSRYFSFASIRHWGAKTTSLTQATTTVCALQSPSATSTLLQGIVEFDTSSTTASIVTLAKASTPYATTSSLGSISIAANSQAVAVASTTGSHIFSPSTYFVVGMQGGTGTFSPVGTCQATWMEI